MDNPIGDRGGHDRHIFIQDGVICVRVWPGGVFKCDEKEVEVCDGEYYHLQLICLKGCPIRVTLDGMQIGENDEVDQSNFDWATQMCFGYSEDAGADKLFRGSIKNFSYEQLSDANRKEEEELKAADDENRRIEEEM